MKARDVMTWGAITVRPDESVARAVRLMLRNKIGGLPVVEDRGQLVGIVTEGDFLRRGELGTLRWDDGRIDLTTSHSMMQRNAYA